MNELNNNVLDLGEIFLPHYSYKVKEAKGKKFVYYTNAETASNIIKNKEIWMRSVRCMNDYSEVEYGLKIVLGVYRQSIEGEMFRNKLNEVFDKITDDIERVFVGWIEELVKNTYITCMSEHLTKEDEMGRLSMWRAYGKNSGIALVINPERVLSESGVLPVAISPVVYFGTDGIKTQLKIITHNIAKNIDQIRNQGKKAVIEMVFRVLMFGILCTKHPGVAEEKEWRIIYCPNIFMETKTLEKEILVVNGIPQPIYKIPLEEIYNTKLKDLLEKVIIGPTIYKSEINKAFVELLLEAGIINPKEKVVNSNIPLRC